MTRAPGGRTAMALVLLMLVAALAGCSGGDGDEPGPAGPQDVADAGFEGEGGRVVGIVTNTEQQPVGGALVAILDVVEATTGANGTFTLSNVPPGEHRILAQALGYTSVAKRVQVEPGNTAEIAFELEAVAVEEPTHETIILAGHICFQMNIVLGIIFNGGNLACAGEGSIFVDFDVDKGVETLIGEMTWEPTSGFTANELNLRFWQGGARSGVFSCDYCYGSAAGPSPVYLRVDGPLKGVEEAESDTSTLTNTIYVPPDSSVPGTGTNIVIDQKVDLYDSAFYGVEAPELFSALPDA